MVSSAIASARATWLARGGVRGVAVSCVVVVVCGVGATTASANLLNRVACSSASQCTAVGSAFPSSSGAVEATLDPATGAENSAGVKTVDPMPPNGAAGAGSVSCPSASQCTATESTGGEVTFDPATGTVNAAGIKTVDPAAAANPSSAGLRSVSCPSVTQCTGVDFAGGEVTFDPTTGAVSATGVKTVAPNLNSVSCPLANQCTASTQKGGTGGAPGDGEVTFDPTTGTVNAAGVKPTLSLPSGDTPLAIAISCPSGSQCTEVDESGFEATFDPTTGTVNAAGTPTVYPASASVTHPPYPGASEPAVEAVSCASAAQCTAVVTDGHEVTFDPTSGAVSSTVLVDPGAGGGSGPSALEQLFSVSCTSESQCTAVDGQNEVTFDPATGVVNAAGVKSLTPPAGGGGGGGSGGGGTVAKPGSGTAKVGAVKTTGTTVGVSVSCAKGGASCAVKLLITVTETLSGGKVIAVASSRAEGAAKKKKKPKRTKKVVVVGSETVKLAAGHSTTAKVSLNGTGRKLLAKHHGLKTKLTVTSSQGGKTRTISSKTVAFKVKAKPKPRPKKH